MRLFIAIHADSYKDDFLELQNQLKKLGINASYPRSCHLTLKFLGEVPDDQVDAVKSVLSSLVFEPFNIEFGECGVFPNQKKIRVVWMGCKPNDALIKLQKNIDALLPHFPPDHNFHPHITLCRVKYLNKKKQKLIDLLKKLGGEGKSLTVTSVSLVESMLTSEGPVYRDLGHFGERQS